MTGISNHWALDLHLIHRVFRNSQIRLSVQLFHTVYRMN